MGATDIRPDEEGVLRTLAVKENPVTLRAILQDS